MHQHDEGIQASLHETSGYLDKLYEEITRTLEKIASREKYINNQLESHLGVRAFCHFSVSCFHCIWFDNIYMEL